MDGRALRILFVESDPADIAAQHHDLRESSDHEVMLATSLQEALGVLLQAGVDVIVTDLHLPDARGLSIVERLRVAAPTAALIALTGFSDQVHSVEALRAGAQDYLQKSGGHRTLRESIAYALERKLAQDPRPVGRLLPFRAPVSRRVISRPTGEVWGHWLDFSGKEGDLPGFLGDGGERVFLCVDRAWLCGEGLTAVLRLGVSLRDVVFVLKDAHAPQSGELARLQAIRRSGGRVVLHDAEVLLSSPWVLEHVDGAVLGSALCGLVERAVPLLLLRALVQFSVEAEWLLVGEGTGERAARLFAVGCPLVVSPAR